MRKKYDSVHIIPERDSIRRAPHENNFQSSLRACILNIFSSTLRTTPCRCQKAS